MLAHLSVSDVSVGGLTGVPTVDDTEVNGDEIVIKGTYSEEFYTGYVKENKGVVVDSTYWY